MLVPDEFMELKPCFVEVECKWFDFERQGGACTARFQIIGVEEDAVGELEQLVHQMALTFE